MQAQKLETRNGTTPWLALVLAAIFAAAVVVGTQIALRSREATTITPAAQTVDRGVALQEERVMDRGVALQEERGMSQSGIRAVGGTAPASSWNFHGPRTDLTGPQIAKVKQLFNGAPSGAPMGAVRR